jgi:hypothetical protein
MRKGDCEIEEGNRKVTCASNSPIMLFSKYISIGPNGKTPKRGSCGSIKKRRQNKQKEGNKKQLTNP